MSSSDSSDDVVRPWSIPEIKEGRFENGKSSSPILTKEEKKALQQQIDQLKERARKEGYEQGMMQAKETVDHYAASFTAIMDQLSEPMKFMSDEVEKQLVDLSVAIARQIVRRELKVDPGQVVAVVRDALSAVPASSQNIRVHLNPEDVNLVNKIIQSNASERKWDLVDDPLLERGGCRIETDNSQVDATIETRVASIAAAIMGGERQNDTQ